MVLNEIEKDIISQIAVAVKKKNGNVYFVGGCVRDKIMGIESKDIDIEIHGIDIVSLEEILDGIGEKLEFGKSFGVYNIRGCSIDIALPRKESCIGNKHTDFKVDVDPFLGTYKAAQRRDFTINAIMEDVISGEIIDHFNGISDLKNGIIRHIDDNTFTEDPLRVFRASQFAARFNFDIAEETKNLCRTIDLTFLSHERVFEELKKALLKSMKPSIFFESLKQMNQLNFWFARVFDLIDVPQNSDFHQEGDVFIHTMMVLDEAAQKRSKTKNQLGFMLAALTHDFGKITATKLENGKLHSHKHEKSGIPIAKEFLCKLTNEKNLIRYVLNMVEQHMKPIILAADGSSIKATNKMFDSSAEPYDLIQLSIADSLGKIPIGRIMESEHFLMERLKIYEEYMSRPFVEGSDLIKAGLTPGPEFTKLLNYAHKLRLAGVEKELALKQTLAYKG